ncbi:MAG: metal ABC transporter substrate-binding protein [Lachnospiraceae bacterium]|nr:metal ABC transporter substrate-binding protein [Lachnospiraceae bacterium]MDE6252681.1 metal ABC transporter substrate-binding protein [Lachnospiraceae bacterium]
MKKRRTTIFTALLITAILISGCAGESKTGSSPGKTNMKENGRLNVVTTLFPYYDFIRQIAGDKVNLTMIVPAGMDTHSFEPTTEDMINIQNSDIFIYNGGSLEHWVTKVLDSTNNKNQTIMRMMDYTDILEEEHKEGMEDEHDNKHKNNFDKKDSDEEEFDEHIWTSPVIACTLVTEICSTLKEADSENADFYQNNCDKYIEQLKSLDKELHNITDNARVKTLIFADKFPLRYFTEEYGLDYFAAFSGCSTDTEPSVDTLKFLIDKVKSEKISDVYYLELSSQKIADTICSSTNAKKKLFYSCHNVSQKQFNDGITYIDMMKKNAETLKEGLK